MCVGNTACFLLNKYLSKLSIKAFINTLFHEVASVPYWILKLYGIINYALQNKNMNNYIYHNYTNHHKPIFLFYIKVKYQSNNKILSNVQRVKENYLMFTFSLCSCGLSFQQLPC